MIELEVVGLEMIGLESIVLGMTLNCSGVRLDNRNVFFVHQVLGPNILSVLFFLPINKSVTLILCNEIEYKQR